MKSVVLLGTVLSLSFSSALWRADAQIITLADQNSLAQINVGSQDGMFRWDVQGQNVLRQQWFWYRVGQTQERSIDTISPAAITLNNGTRGLSTFYANNQFGVRVDYLLSGGPVVGIGQPASSDIGETITIYNYSGTTLPFSFFQYSHFDLGGPGGDTVQLGKNIRGLWNEASQVEGIGGLSETVTAPGANHGEAALFNQTLLRLNDGAPTVLNDIGGPVGPGSVTWALQWDLNIGPGAYAIISKDKFVTIGIIPEPASAALLGLGVLGFAWRRNRRVS